jgi:hypothetical protein
VFPLDFPATLCIWVVSVLQPIEKEQDGCLRLAIIDLPAPGLQSSKYCATGSGNFPVHFHIFWPYVGKIEFKR